MNSDITYDEWFEEVCRLEEENRLANKPAGFTSQEIADRQHIGLDKARKWIKQKLQEGRMVVVRRKTFNMTGKMTTVAAYQPVIKKVKKSPNG